VRTELDPMVATRFALVMVYLTTANIYAEGPSSNWVKVTDHADWQPRDSQGEMVFNDRLWILGGWFDSRQPAPRDVWASADGKTWKIIQQRAPWKHGDLPMALVFDHNMWLMGGWYNGRLPDHSASNSVWCSTDGANWRQVTEHAGWSPRIAAGVVEFQGKMWILGGTEQYYSGDDRNLKNDIWSSTDGKNWKLEVANAPWTPRAFHQAVVLNDKIYLIGGGNYLPNYRAWNDVWRSADGVHWDRVTAAAPWNPRLWFSAVVYRDRIWVLGGWSNNPSRNWGDVWYSKNGADWIELKSDVVWKPRHEHSAFVFQNKIWVAGGMTWPLSNDVWTLELPKSWLPAKSAN
jgi:Kelch motif